MAELDGVHSLSGAERRLPRACASVEERRRDAVVDVGRVQVGLAVPVDVAGADQVVIALPAGADPGPGGEGAVALVRHDRSDTTLDHLAGPAHTLDHREFKRLGPVPNDPRFVTANADLDGWVQSFAPTGLPPAPRARDESHGTKHPRVRAPRSGPSSARTKET